MKKYLFLAVVAIGFLASCTADDVDTTTKLNNVEELEGMPVKDKTRD